MFSPLQTGCPCLYTTPCHPHCSCVESNPRGCQRCCRYGSPEQQKAMAEHLATLSDQVVALKREKAEARHVAVALYDALEVARALIGEF